MLRIKNFNLLTSDELCEKGEDRFADGKDYGERKYKQKIEELEEKVEDYKAQIKSLNRKNKILTTEVEVLESDRDNVREVLTLQMELKDKESELETTKELLDSRTAKLVDRESRLGTEEDKRFKEGYADGVADGVRKISQISQEDRNNAMKVAMVSAASHSQPEVVKAAMQIGDGTDNQ